MTSEVGAFLAPTRAPRSLFWLGEARGWCDTMVRITDHQRCRINQPLLRPGVASVAQSYTHTALPSCTGAFPGERERTRKDSLERQKITFVNGPGRLETL